MTKLLALLDTWGVMTYTCFFTAVGILLWNALLYHGSGSQENVLLCLAEGGLGFILFLSLNSTRRGIWIRLAMIATATLILWFQPTPWLGIDDSAFVRVSFEQEYLRQRLVQIGEFALFAMPFACLGALRRSRKLPPLSEDASIEKTSRVSPIVIALIPILCGLVLRLIGVSMAQETIRAIVEGAVTLVSLFWLALRAERGDKGVSKALAAMAVGVPIISFWK